MSHHFLFPSRTGALAGPVGNLFPLSVETCFATAQRWSAFNPVAGNEDKDQKTGFHGGHLSGDVELGLCVLLPQFQQRPI
jgi:hypothetical protein